jgi:hypothetical protein
MSYVSKEFGKSVREMCTICFEFNDPVIQALIQIFAEVEETTIAHEDSIVQTAAGALLTFSKICFEDQTSFFIITEISFIKRFMTESIFTLLSKRTLVFIS